ncbi:hypothetical protein ACOMHN_056575 [Nucella lapillus]
MFLALLSSASRLRVFPSLDRSAMEGGGGWAWPQHGVCSDVSDPCPDHQMEVGGLYLAYLYKHHPHLYTPAFTPHPDTYMDEMFIVCDLNITTPTGAAEAMEEEGVQLTCEDDKPDYSDYEEICIRYTPQPGKTSHRAKEKPNQPGQTGKVERGGEGEGSGGVQTSLPLCLPLLLSAAFCTTLP